MLTRQKAVDQIRHNARQKRGGGQVRGDSIFGDESLAGGFDEFLGSDPTPEFLAMLQEEHERLLGKLRDDNLRRIALDRMAGFTYEEIAQRMDLTTPTVKRKLRTIQNKWAADLGETVT